jgi:hypothetical protein
MDCRNYLSNGYHVSICYVVGVQIWMTLKKYLAVIILLYSSQLSRKLQYDSNDSRPSKMTYFHSKNCLSSEICFVINELEFNLRHLQIAINNFEFFVSSSLSLIWVAIPYFRSFSLFCLNFIFWQIHS